MQHSALGDRWVYDAVGDPVAVACFGRALRGEQAQAEMELWEEGAVVERRESSVRLRVEAGRPSTSPEDADGARGRGRPAEHRPDDRHRPGRRAPPGRRVAGRSRSRRRLVRDLTVPSTGTPTIWGYLGCCPVDERSRRCGGHAERGEISPENRAKALARPPAQGIELLSRSPPGGRDQPERRSTLWSNPGRWLGDEASGIGWKAGSIGSVTSTDRKKGPCCSYQRGPFAFFEKVLRAHVPYDLRHGSPHVHERSTGGRPHVDVHRPAHRGAPDREGGLAADRPRTGSGADHRVVCSWPATT